MRSRKPDLSEHWKRLADDPNDQSSLDAIVRAFLPLVKSIASSIYRRAPGGADLDDMISAGSIGLLHAIRKYDQARGVSFSTFAGRRISGAIMDELREMDSMSRTTRRISRAIEQAETRLTASIGRTPTSRQLASSLGVREESLVSLESLQASLASRVGFESARFEVPLSDIAVDHRTSPAAHDLTTSDAFEHLLRTCSDRESSVVRSVFIDGLNQREAGDVLGVCESRANQLLASAFRKIRNRIDARVRTTESASNRASPKASLGELHYVELTERSTNSPDAIAYRAALAAAEHRESNSAQDPEPFDETPEDPHLLDQVEEPPPFEELADEPQLQVDQVEDPEPSEGPEESRIDADPLPAIVVDRLAIAWELLQLAGDLETARSAIAWCAYLCDVREP